MSAKDQIASIVNRFKKEPYLKDKTDLMGDGLLLGGNLADEANERSVDSKTTVLAIQEKYKEQILAQDLNPNKDPELVDLRGGKATAGERMTDFEQFTTAQFQQTRKRENNIKETLFFAHRGAETIVPENTVASTELACSMGYDGVEGDAQVTLDKEWVMYHDDTLDLKTNGTGAVNTKTLAEIKALTITSGPYMTRNGGMKIATVREYFEVCVKWGKIPMLEIKQADIVDLPSLFDLINEFNLVEKIYLAGNSEVLKYCKDTINPNFNAFSLINPNEETISYVEYNLPFSTVGISQSFATKEMIDDIHDRGLECSVWTINQRDYELVDKYKSWGIQSIIGSVM